MFFREYWDELVIDLASLLAGEDVWKKNPWPSVDLSVWPLITKAR